MFSVISKFSSGRWRPASAQSMVWLVALDLVLLPFHCLLSLDFLRLTLNVLASEVMTPWSTLGVIFRWDSQSQGSKWNVVVVFHFFFTATTLLWSVVKVCVAKTIVFSVTLAQDLLNGRRASSTLMYVESVCFS